jgi:hypothetical protein
MNTPTRWKRKAAIITATTIGLAGITSTPTTHAAAAGSNVVMFNPCASASCTMSIAADQVYDRPVMVRIFATSLRTNTAVRVGLNSYAVPDAGTPWSLTVTSPFGTDHVRWSVYKLVHNVWVADNAKSFWFS